jgi:hypothetical protein
MENVEPIDKASRITCELGYLNEPVNALKTEVEIPRTAFRNGAYAVLLAGFLLLDSISIDAIHFFKREYKAFQEAVINNKKDAEEVRKEVLFPDPLLSSRLSKMEFKA